MLCRNGNCRERWIGRERLIDRELWTGRESDGFGRGGKLTVGCWLIERVE